MPLRILYLEDSELDVKLAMATLHRHAGPCDILWAKDRHEYVELLKDPDLDLVLSDYMLPTIDGFAALDLCRATRPLLPFILISGTIGEERAVEALRRGATDYVLKGNMQRLPMVVNRALAEVREHAERTRVDEERQSLLEAASLAKVVPWKQEIPSKVWVFGESAATVLGYHPPQLREDPGMVESLIHNEDVHRFVSARSRSETGQAVGFDCRMRHGAGPWIWTRWTMAKSPDVFRGVLQDVTELHTAQEQLILSQKAEAASVMVSGLCHDFNNHIMVIQANADVLAGGPIPDTHRRFVANIKRAAERSQEMIRQLLGFARKSQETRRVPQGINELLDEAAGLLRHALPSHIHLEMDIQQPPCEVFVDPGQIIQVLMNLGINARDAIEKEGTLTLRSGEQHLDSAEAEIHELSPGFYAFFEVEDTGDGIPDGIRRKIFDPFFTTKPTGQGTGLGLAMVQAIVKSHDGLILCDSELGRGTRFRVLLPCIDRSHRAAPA